MEYISLVEYARMHGVSPDTARQRVLRGHFRTAKKIGRNWVIDKSEPYNDNRKINGYIYMISNNCNEKVYIGQTITTIKSRFKEHCNSYETSFDKEIKLLGTSHFSVKEIDTAHTMDELVEKETYYINKFDSIKNGYNVKIPYKQGERNKKTAIGRENINIGVDGELLLKIKLLAEKNNRTVSNYIEYLLKREIDKENQRKGEHNV